MKTCIKCGSTEFSERGECRQCARLRSAEYRKANPEKTYASKRESRAKKLAEYLEKERLWRESNKDKTNENNKAYYAANTDKIKNSTKEYRKLNKDKSNLWGKAWRANNPSKVKLMKDAFRKKNPELWRRYSRNRRALLRNSVGTLSKGLVEFLLEAQRGLCPCCRQPLGDDYHADHIIPLALGGLNCDSNIQLLRSICNRQKSAKHPIDFMQSRGFLL